MSAPVLRPRISRLNPEVTRLLFVRNLPFKITKEDLYELFGRYGAVHSIYLGNTNETRGTCYIMYCNIYDAKMACDDLDNKKMGKMYLRVQYYNKKRMEKNEEDKKRRRELDERQMDSF